MKKKRNEEGKLCKYTILYCNKMEWINEFSFIVVLIKIEMDFNSQNIWFVEITSDCVHSMLSNDGVAIAKNSPRSMTAQPLNVRNNRCFHISFRLFPDIYDVCQCACAYSCMCTYLCVFGLFVHENVVVHNMRMCVCALCRRQRRLLLLVLLQFAAASFSTHKTSRVL